MKERPSIYKIVANHRNGSLSKGPETTNGKAVSKKNALKHGLRSDQVVIKGRCIRENAREFNALHQRLWEDLKPVGTMEEILVEQVATTCWRLRRVLKAESGEITLSVDNGQWHREDKDFNKSMFWDLAGDPVNQMRRSAFGNQFLYQALKDVRDSVEKEGYLTEAAVKSVKFHGRPFSLTKQLQELRIKLQQNPHGLDDVALRAKQKQEALACLDEKLRLTSWNVEKHETREETDEHSHQAANVLPSADTLDKILRYESSLQKKLYRALNHLERLQRRRMGENVPPPQVLEISTGV